ncbi:MAG: SGNH/GDSL hydrolase family protein [Actinomycetota bacterium]
MTAFSPLLLLCTAALLTLAAEGRAAERVPGQSGESVVMAGVAPAKLMFGPVVKGSVAVRSTFRPGQPNTVQYREGRDFVVDYAAGTIRRVEGSAIPDYSKNQLFGVKDFNHVNYPGFGNFKEFVFVDYRPKARFAWPVQPSQQVLLRRTRERLERGESLKVAAFGDSITAGGDATAPGLIYWEQWLTALRKRYPNATITGVNSATGGDTTVQGLARLEAKVLAAKPDLVLVAFGMNDQNIGSVPLDRFEANLHELVDRIKKSTSAEIVLLSSCLPNPNWHYTSGRMPEYGKTTRKVAVDRGCAFADVLTNWQTVVDRKKPEDLLANNVNHPNDFGHWIYFQVLEKLGL